MTAGKKNWVTLFTAVLAHQLAVSHLMVMYASFHDHRKFLWQPWVLQIEPILLSSVGVALNQYRRFCFGTV